MSRQPDGGRVYLDGRRQTDREKARESPTEETGRDGERGRRERARKVYATRRQRNRGKTGRTFKRKRTVA